METKICGQSPFPFFYRPIQVGILLRDRRKERKFRGTDKERIPSFFLPFLSSLRPLAQTDTSEPPLSMPTLPIMSMSYRRFCLWVASVWPSWSGWIWIPATVRSSGWWRSPPRSSSWKTRTRSLWILTSGDHEPHDNLCKIDGYNIKKSLWKKKKKWTIPENPRSANQFCLRRDK